MRWTVFRFHAATSLKGHSGPGVAAADLARGEGGSGSLCNFVFSGARRVKVTSCGVRSSGWGMGVFVSPGASAAGWTRGGLWGDGGLAVEAVALKVTEGSEGGGIGSAVGGLVAVELGHGFGFLNDAEEGEGLTGVGAEELELRVVFPLWRSISISRRAIPRR